jgi:hypothetical protein
MARGEALARKSDEQRHMIEIDLEKEGVRGVVRGMLVSMIALSKRRRGRC